VFTGNKGSDEGSKGAAGGREAHILFLNSTFLAVVRVRHAIVAADHTASLVGPVVTLVADAHQCAGPHVRIANDALSIACGKEGKGGGGDRRPHRSMQHDFSCEGQCTRKQQSKQTQTSRYKQAGTNKQTHCRRKQAGANKQAQASRGRSRKMHDGGAKQSNSEVLGRHLHFSHRRPMAAGACKCER